MIVSSLRLRLHLAPLAGRGRIGRAVRSIVGTIRVRGRLREGNRNRFKNARHVTEHVVVPEPQQPIIVIHKPFVADRITPIIRMLPAIDLDNETTIAANQIDRVRTDRLLPDELVAVQRARPGSAPQGVLGIGRIATQTSGTFGFRFISLAHVATPPHPDCFAIRPLPASGERLVLALHDFNPRRAHAA
jgi:hypothetical protein